MSNPFEKPVEGQKPQSEEIELPPTNRVWGRDVDKGRLKLAQNMFEIYLARTEVKDVSQIGQHFDLKGEEWRKILDAPEMQFAFQKYLSNHESEDIEAMRDMEELVAAFRQVSQATLQ